MLPWVCRERSVCCRGSVEREVRVLPWVSRERSVCCRGSVERGPCAAVGQ